MSVYNLLVALFTIIGIAAFILLGIEAIVIAIDVISGAFGSVAGLSRATEKA